LHNRINVPARILPDRGAAAGIGVSLRRFARRHRVGPAMAQELTTLIPGAVRKEFP